MDTVGQRIKDARAQKNMTQSELADKLNISFTLISQYERGLRNPKEDTLKRIADALEVDVNWLRNGQTLEERDQVMKDHVTKRFKEAEAADVYLDGLTSDERQAVETIVHSMREKKSQDKK